MSRDPFAALRGALFFLLFPVALVGGIWYLLTSYFLDNRFEFDIYKQCVKLRAFKRLIRSDGRYYDDERETQI